MVWCDSQIVALVPSGATSGPITVVVNGISAPSSTAFQINNPIINSVAPPSAAPGGTIRVIGTGFGATQGSSLVQFTQNGVAVSGTIVSWSDTSIRVTISANLATGPYSITVTENGLVARTAYRNSLTRDGDDPEVE